MRERARARWHRHFRQNHAQELERNARRKRERRYLLRAQGDLSESDLGRLADQADTCTYCGERLPCEARDRTMDHVIPLRVGGSNTMANVVPACRSCNAKKASRTPSQWIAAAS